MAQTRFQRLKRWPTMLSPLGMTSVSDPVEAALTLLETALDRLEVVAARPAPNDPVLEQRHTVLRGQVVATLEALDRLIDQIRARPAQNHADAAPGPAEAPSPMNGPRLKAVPPPIEEVVPLLPRERVAAAPLR